MGSFAFIGLGLNDENGLTLEGLQIAKSSETVFAEFYTNLMPNLDKNRLESLIGKKIRILSRNQLEDEDGKELIEAVQKGDAALLVPGDPMIATTHISLRITLSKHRVPSRIVHSASIMSAICGATGLQSYKFGKTVTIPYDDPLPKSVTDAIFDNQTRGLHTLLLLDVRTDNKQLTISEGLRKIRTAVPKSDRWLVVGSARIAAPDERIRAGSVELLTREDFGGPPQSIVVVGNLHFMEAEALRIFADARETDLSSQK